MENSMTSKQRAYLKGLAMTIDPIYQIGKSALTPEITEGVSDALEARELIKITVLKNCSDDINEMAQILSERTHSEIVQVIGKKIVLYRESKEKKKIELPVEKKSKSKEQ
jgi:RNA-binding protein